MDKIRLFRKTDTTLVYIASDEFVQEIHLDIEEQEYILKCAEADR